VERVADQVHQHDVDHPDEEDDERHAREEGREELIGPQDRETTPGVIGGIDGGRPLRHPAGPDERGGDGHQHEGGRVDGERHARSKCSGQQSKRTWRRASLVSARRGAASSCQRSIQGSSVQRRWPLLEVSRWLVIAVACASTVVTFLGYRMTADDSPSTPTPTA
jgi:hypothetical protein